jgi:hypothetical protein
VSERLTDFASLSVICCCCWALSFDARERSFCVFGEGANCVSFATARVAKARAESESVCYFTPCMSFDLCCSVFG